MELDMNLTTIVPAQGPNLEASLNTTLHQPGAVGRQVESLFVSLLLKEMRQSGSSEGLFPGDSSDTLGGLFDLYLGQFITESGGIGLSDTVEDALSLSQTHSTSGES